ncbi:DUF4145 domain-containing protein [Chitinimonas sp. PSY-7]|uniref:DUF4145 domain-containing protein n=1 Tax=Chitinimonas sp. PSY-7 TaxID=3459088 RepID=UPI004040145F
MIVECFHCRQYVDAQEAGSYWRNYNGLGPARRYTLLRCPTCQEPILVSQTNIGNIADGDIWDTPVIVFPESDIRVNPIAPREIRTAFEEACTCYRAQAYTASAIMCRKTLEGICIVHGINERNLQSAIKKMKEQSLIDDRLYEWSDVLRIVGNEAVHDVGVVLSQPDAKDTIEFTNAILDYLFSYRDRFEQFKRRRSSK